MTQPIDPPGPVTPPPPSPGPTAPAPVTSTAPVRRRGPKVLTVIGLVATVVGWGGFIAGFVFLGANFLDAFEEGLDPASKLDLRVDVPGEGSVDLEPGRYQVVALGPRLTSISGRSSDAGGYDVNRLPFAEPPFDVRDSEGNGVDLRPPGIDRVTHGPGLDAVGLYEFTVPTAGRYTLDVSGERGAVVALGIGEAKGLWEEAKGWVAASIVIMIGAFLGTIGIFVLIGGIVWGLLVRRPTTTVTPPPYPMA
jgi:hypothetical protein